MNQEVNILLKIELHSAIKSIGFETSGAENLVTEENLYRIINLIERLILNGGSEKNIAAICALLWTHFHEDFDLLADYINSAMARIGFSPVSKMLRDETGKITSSSIASTLEGHLQSQKYVIKSLGKRLTVTEFQKRLWDQLKSSRRVAVSAPTSAGKSYLLCLRAVENALEHGGVSFYIVPTLTLMNQVATDLFEISRDSKRRIKILTTLDESIKTANEPTFYVLTQERITETATALSFSDLKVTQLIVDEVQNIERAFDMSDDNPRAKLLLDVIIDLHDKFRPRLSVVSGPRISDIRSMASSLFNSECDEVSTTSSPVVNIAYSILPAGRRVEVKQFSELSSGHLSQTLNNDIDATGFGKSSYTEGYQKYLFNVLKKNKGGLVFSPTTLQCRKTALAISTKLSISKAPRIKQLVDFVKSTVSPSYDLANCIEKRVAFHHSKLPAHVRSAVEFAIGNSMIDHVVCTTTLMQGVNIPAKTVVLRNPDLFVRTTGGEKPQLSSYEIANLRGRAGRLLKDFVGRTFILDGTSFEEAEVQTSLFKAAEKAIDGSYSNVFDTNREEILHSLTSPSGSAEPNSVASYIASAIYTEDSPQKWLDRKGIKMTSAEVSAVESQLKRLTVSETVCKKFRYWSPFELDVLAKSTRNFRTPTSLYSSGLAELVESTLRAVREIIPARASKHLSRRSLSDKVLPVLASNAVRWAREDPLFDILNNRYCRESSENTESAIGMLQKDISFGIPALLGPIYAIKEEDPSILSFFERGASSNETRILINSNIPREISIATSNRMKAANRSLQSVSDAINFIQEKKIDFWSSINFKHLTSLESIIAA